MKTKEEIKNYVSEWAKTLWDEGGSYDQLASWIHALQTPEPEWLPIPEDRRIKSPAWFSCDPTNGDNWVVYNNRVPHDATHYCPITPPKPLPKPDAFEEVVKQLPNLPEHAKSQEAALAVLRHVWDAALEHARKNVKR